MSTDPSPLGTEVNWAMVGGIAAVIALPLAVIAIGVQYATSSDGQPLVSSSVATAPPASASAAPSAPLSTSNPSPLPPAENEPAVRSSDSFSRSGSSAWGISIFDSGDNWVQNPAGSSVSVTITVDGSYGVTAGDGASFAAVPEPSYASCSTANYNLQAREWKDLPSGSALCIRTSDTRVGRVQFIWKKGKEDPAADVRVVGVIWEPKHE